MQGRTIAIVTDLIFATKIRSTAEAVGARVDLVRNVNVLRDSAAAGPIAQVIIDLNSDGLDAATAIATAKSLPGQPRVITYLSHVQIELAERARAAGADEVMPRSTFSERLPAILANN